MLIFQKALNNPYDSNTKAIEMEPLSDGFACHQKNAKWSLNLVMQIVKIIFSMVW